MQRSEVPSGKVAMFRVIAGFLLTFTAGFLPPVEGNGIATLRNFSVASTQSEGERPDVSINADPKDNSSLTRPLRICCPVAGGFLSDYHCEKFDHLNNSTTLEFPTQQDSLSLQSLPGRFTYEDFHMFALNPCVGRVNYTVRWKLLFDEDFKFLSNGSVISTDLGRLLDYKKYCIVALVNRRIYKILVCGDLKDHNDDVYILKKEIDIVLSVAMIVSVPFLLLTFFIYSVIPELRNMHGYTLRGYVSSLVLLYTINAYLKLKPPNNISDNVCVFIAFISNFSISSCFFWLNVICFDMWWTFRGFRSNQGTMKQRGMKKFTMYSLYAWGSASLSSGLCAIIKLVSSIPRSFRQQISMSECRLKPNFSDEKVMSVLIYFPIIIIWICNACLFISTTITLCRHKVDTARYLRGTNSEHHNENKFSLYLKLFIMMGISWPTAFILDNFENSNHYIQDIQFITFSLQGVYIFLIFVWKDRTKRLLLKRFGCRNKRPIYQFNQERLLQFNLEDRDQNSEPAPLNGKIIPYTERNKTITD